MAYLGAMTFSGSLDDDGDPDYVYYNATISNNQTVTQLDAINPAIRFQETRSIPIVKDCSKYNMSIVRFTMDGKDLPLFIPVIRTGADNPTNDINLTIYSVSLMATFNYTIGGNPYTFTAQTTQPLIWTPETLDLAQAPVPLASTTQTGQDITTRYYWCYTYTHWLQILNTAFEACITDLQTQFAANWLAPAGWNQPGPVPSIQTAAPTMTYNPTTNLFTLYADRYGFGGAARTGQSVVFPAPATGRDESFRLFFNANTFGLFANFNNTYYNYPNGLTNEILIYPILYQNILTTPSPPAPSAKSYWIMNQDYESTSALWCPIESIVFTSSLLPLVFEQTGDPVRFGDSLLGAQGNIQAAFTPILTDVAVFQENASAYRGYIQYAPSAEYRLSSFQRSKTPINNVDIQVFWKSRLDGQLYPVQMFNGSSVSFKMMLRRRGVFDYPHPAKGGVDV
jgi:hypothetical protein